jgi:conserved domain protein
MLPDNILEVLLEKIINNWRKVYGSILGFIVGLTVVNYGILKAIVIFVFAFIGYKLGDSSFTKNMKKMIINRLKED